MKSLTRRLDGVSPYQCVFARIPLVGQRSAEPVSFFYLYKTVSWAHTGKMPMFRLRAGKMAVFRFSSSRRRSCGPSQSCRCIYTSLVGYGGGIGSGGWGPPGLFTWQITELQVPFRVSEHWF